MVALNVANTLFEEPDARAQRRTLHGFLFSVSHLLAFPRFLGYATGCFGKWNVGFAAGTRPTEEGFDEFIGTPAGQIDYYTYKYGERHALYRGIEEYHTDKYATDLWADSSIDFIKRNADRPFFIYLPFNAPHEPLIATDLLPMILAAAGLPAPTDHVLDGIDPTSILAGRAAAPD